MKLINPAVGDALSDMLYCMAALQVSFISLLYLNLGFLLLFLKDFLAISHVAFRRC